MKVLFFLLFSMPGIAQIQLTPIENEFYQHASGSYLDLFTDGLLNTKIYGTGESFGPRQQEHFQKLVSPEGQSSYEWVLRELNSNKILFQSLNPEKQFYGASVSKVFVAGAYLNSVNGMPTASGLQHLNDMIIVSSNSSWGALQVDIGLGNENIGRKKIRDFLLSLNITRSIGYRGYLDGVHGNEVNALDISRFIQASFDGKYPGSKHLFQTMFLSRTGEFRGRKYFPILMNVAGKTGTYSGETSVGGAPVISESKHHTMVFSLNGKFYSLTVLSDPGSDEDIAILCGGLLRLL
jgi:hypothetical protein